MCTHKHQTQPTLPKVETQRRHPLMPLSRTSTTGSISLAHRPGRLSSAQTSLFFSLAREIELDLHPSGSAGYSVIPPDRLTGLAHSFDLPPATAEGLLRNYCVPLTIRDQDGTVHGAWSIPEDVPLPKIRSGERNVVRPLTAMLIQVRSLPRAVVENGPTPPIHHVFHAHKLTVHSAPPDQTGGGPGGCPETSSGCT